MANRSEAYDFSLFEERMSAVQPQRGPEREKQQRRNIVELPERELKKNARPKRHPLRAMATLACFAVIFCTVISIVYSQVQITELTDEINTVNTQLQEAQSLEIQLNMQATQKMNGTQIEEYAVNQLGMNKISGNQVTYMNVAQDDRGTVVKEVSGGSIIDQLLTRIRELFA